MPWQAPNHNMGRCLIPEEIDPQAVEGIVAGAFFQMPVQQAALSGVCDVISFSLLQNIAGRPEAALRQAGVHGSAPPDKRFSADPPFPVVVVILSKQDQTAVDHGRILVDRGLQGPHRPRVELQAVRVVAGHPCGHPPVSAIGRRLLLFSASQPDNLVPLPLRHTDHCLHLLVECLAVLPAGAHICVIFFRQCPVFLHGPVDSPQLFLALPQKLLGAELALIEDDSLLLGLNKEFDPVGRPVNRHFSIAVHNAELQLALHTSSIQVLPDAARDIERVAVGIVHLEADRLRPVDPGGTTKTGPLVLYKAVQLQRRVPLDLRHMGKPRHGLCQRSAVQQIPIHPDPGIFRL